MELDLSFFIALRMQIDPHLDRLDGVEISWIHLRMSRVRAFRQILLTITKGG